MLRWFFLLLGLAAIAMGIVGYTMHPPIPEAPQTVSIEEAIALFPDTDRIAVTVSASADLTARIYLSLVEQPPHTRRRPGDTHDLPAVATVPREELESYLGARVRYAATAGAIGVSLMGVEERTLQDDEVLSERLLVPLAGSNEQLWALSPTFADDGSAASRWRAQSTFTGVVSQIGDIGVNTASWDLEFSFEEIQHLVLEEHGIYLGPDVLLLIDGATEEPASLFYLPLEGSDGRLLVTPFHEGQPLPAWVESGPVTGVLWVWDVDEDERGDLERVFGGELGPRYGVIHHDDTALELNRKTRKGLRVFVGLGLVLWFLAGVGFVRARRR